MRIPLPTETRASPLRDLTEPLVLPPPPDPPRRGAIPLLASVVPIVAAGALWLSTGSTAMLWFAALGPVIAGASALDAARTRRRDRLRAQEDAAATRLRITAAVERRHADERAALWARCPDVAGLLAVGPDGLDRVWRTSHGGAEMVVGRGDVPSTVRVSGGSTEEDLPLKRRAATLTDAPVTVPVSTGIAVVGPDACAAAVVRALALQLALAAPPGALRVIGRATGDATWTSVLPHRTARTGVALALTGPGDPPPDADIVIARVVPGAPPPPACTAVLTLTAIDRGVLLHDGTARDVEVEAVGRDQAVEIASRLARRAVAVSGTTVELHPQGLAELLPGAPSPRRGALPAVVGVCDGSPFVVDLVSDGPHAIVAGMTGAGKSELLTTWVTSLCATHSTEDVVFLLADFKGGTAFDPLRAMPHVTGVVTDLDGGGAVRALESLWAELRRREAELVRMCARDIAEPQVRMPRLVIVVDEFAALAAAHPDMTAVFTDIAARGRALGMHLVLGTQRATGVMRDALTANCPLRISLRVTDPGDSRAVVGTDAAAWLSGEADSQGVALVRRAADAAPCRVRIALTAPTSIDAAVRDARGPAPRRPWLPELPARLSLEELSVRASRRRAAEGIVLGLADEPEHQRQPVITLRPTERGLAVVGRVGSGRTSLLSMIAAQSPQHTWIGADPEPAWDALAALAAEHPARGRVLLVDDVDLLLAALPADYAQAAVERLETLLRGAGGDGGTRVFLTAQRLTGGVGRLFDLVPRRVVLATGSRAEHVAVGGEPGEYRDRLPPGRGTLDGRRVQFALAPDVDPSEPAEVAPVWCPEGLTGVVVRGGAGARGWADAARAAGATVRDVEDAAAFLGGTSDPPGQGRSRRPFLDSSGPPTVIVGEADAWHRAVRVLSSVRSEHTLLIDAECPADYRVLTGDREPPPYCDPGRGRAWLVGRDGVVRRVRRERDG